MTLSTPTGHLCVPRQLSRLYEVESLVERVCTDEGIDSRQTYFVTLAVSELVSNIVRHGICDSTPDVVELSLVREKSELRIVVEDFCRVLPGAITERYALAAPEPVVVPTSIEACAESGRGVDLILRTATSVKYTRCGTRNRMELCFSLAF